MALSRRDAFLRQARSDFAVFDYLLRQGERAIAECLGRAAGGQQFCRRDHPVPPDRKRPRYFGCRQQHLLKNPQSRLICQRTRDELCHTEACDGFVDRFLGLFPLERLVEFWFQTILFERELGGSDRGLSRQGPILALNHVIRMGDQRDIRFRFGYEFCAGEERLDSGEHRSGK